MAILLISGLVACSRQYEAASPPEKDRKELSRKDTVIPIGHERQLAQLLEGIAGVYVRYDGGNIQVLVRGGRPLFVVDNVPLGYNYESVNNLVNVHDIDHIEVLKNMSETALYGYRARHGVIHIHTKRGVQ